MQAEADIPDALRPAADAALAWINNNHAQDFELTGVVDYEAALAAGPAEPYELGLILCDGEICTREQVRIEPAQDGYRVSPLEAPESDIPPLLDPQPGLRSGWLDDALANHEFVLLLFYRGLW